MRVMKNRINTDSEINEDEARGDGFSLGKSPVIEEHKPGRHYTAARTKWTMTMNIVVMERYDKCYGML